MGNSSGGVSLVTMTGTAVCTWLENGAEAFDKVRLYKTRNTYHSPKILTLTFSPRFSSMRPPARNRTTSTPGAVDLPAPRRSSEEVALEKKRKSDAAEARAKAIRLAAARVAEIENKALAAAKDKRSGTSTPGPKKSRKRPGASTTDVSLLRWLIR